MTTSHTAARRAPYRVPGVPLTENGVNMCLGAFGAAVCFMVGSTTLATFFLSFTVFRAIGALRRRSSRRALQALTEAMSATAAGQLSRAEELLALAESSARPTALRRAIDLEKALIATRRGDLPRALRHADAAVEHPVDVGLLAGAQGEQDRSQVVAARALRALIRASSGDHRGAEDDIAAVRGHADAPLHARARAELAAAVLLERAGDRAGLREHLTRERRSLLEHTLPRERAIVRAYGRMLDAPMTTVYRRSAAAAMVGASHEEPALADWVSAIAPAAAAFVPSEQARPGHDDGGSADSAAAGSSLAAARAKIDEPARRAARRLKVLLIALGATLSLPFLGAALLWVTGPKRYPVIPAPSRAPPSAPARREESLWPLVIISVAFIGMSWRRDAASRRRLRLLQSATNSIGRGEYDAAERMLAPLVAAGRGRIRDASSGAQGLFLSAWLAERRGELSLALQHCDEGLALLWDDPSARALASDGVLPSLLAERSFLLTALDRDDDAEAALGVLAETCPAYAFLSTARHRVALARAARRGDLEEAARLADQGKDLYLDLRDELLGDVARAVVSPDALGARELARLREDLRSSEEASCWLDAVAPGLTRALMSSADTEVGRARAESATRSGSEAEEAEAAAERDAEAEASEIVGRRRAGIV